MLVGYMAENTLGRRLKNREPEVKIFGEWHQVRAEILQINAFSAHADYSEIAEWLDSLDTANLKKLLMVHGEPDAQKFLQSYLKEHGYESHIMKYGEVIEL